MTKAEVGVAATDAAHFETAAEDRIVDMHRLLAELTDLSDADALRVLRETFPDTTLAERVRVLRSSRN